MLRIRSDASDVDLLLITPTGDRPEAFALCERWIARQRFGGTVRWVVVDDGDTPTRCTLGQEHLWRPHAGKRTKHTLAHNLRTAIDHICSPRSDQKIAIIEDDDFYAQTYLEQVSSWLEDADLVGESPEIYYNLAHRSWREVSHETHACLSQTAFRATVLPTLQRVCEADGQAVDILLWRRWRGSRRLVHGPESPSCVGIKGMPGRPGKTAGWSRDARHVHDPQGSRLAELIGHEDAAPYGELAPHDWSEQPVVFTAIFGGYDELPRPVAEPGGWRFVCFTDDARGHAEGWDVVRVQRRCEDATRAARRFKLLAHRWFPKAAWTLWLDGNVRLEEDPAVLTARYAAEHPEAELFVPAHPERDCLYQEARICAAGRNDDPALIRAQVDRYRSEGFPEHAGLVESRALLRRKSSRVERFNETWWQEIERGSRRDQLGFTYAARRCELRYFAFPGRRKGRAYIDPTFFSVEAHAGRRRELEPRRLAYWRQRYVTCGALRTDGHRQCTKAESARHRAEVERLLAPHLPARADAVLDFGCGGGRWYPLLAGRSRQYHACNIVDVVRPPGGLFELMRSGRVPFGDRRFDWIWCSVVLQHVLDEDEMRAYVRQFHERLNPGGTLILIENVDAGRPDNDYMRYRKESDYLDALEGFESRVVGYHEFGVRQPHAVIVARKSERAARSIPALVSPPTNAPKRKGRTFLAGPFLGELGWELFCWQGRLRWLSQGYARTHVLCRPGHEVLYRDFALVGVLPEGLREGHLLHDLDVLGPNQRPVDYDPGWSERELRAKHFHEQAFHRYGADADSAAGFDVVIHARARSHRPRDNWPEEHWEELLDGLQGLRVAWIGSRGSAYEFEGRATDDDRCDRMDRPLAEVVELLAASRLIVGTSSGPLHLASLCGCPQVVLSPESNRARYERHWNPFGTPCSIVPGGWNPRVRDVLAAVEHSLQEEPQLSGHS